MVETEFALFQMQQKGMLGHASKLLQATFSKAPKRLHAVNVGRALYELIVPVLHSIRTIKAHVH